MALALLPTLERTVRRTPQPPLRRSRQTVCTETEQPRLSVVIVNYYLWEQTAELVRQLLAVPCTQRGEVEVVVVDNHSPFHPLARRLRRWPGVSLRRWGRNRGFARAVNEGCRLSRGQWVLLLNPDISVAKNFLDGVLSLMERLPRQEPHAGIVGFQLRNSDGSTQLSSGPFPTLMKMLARLALPRKWRKYHFPLARQLCRVPWVTGCCLLLRRSCLEQLGGLDQDFFLYYEDVDLCRRARDQGWSVLYEPALRVTHHNPLHLRNVPAYLRLLTRHALLTYASKHWPTWQMHLLARIIRCEAWFRRCSAVLQGDHAAAQLFRALDGISADLARCRPERARRRLDLVVRHQEQSHAYDLVRGDPQPQPFRLAPVLLEQRNPACAAT